MFFTFFLFQDIQFFEHILNLDNEVRSIDRLIDTLRKYLNLYSSVDEDRLLLSQISECSNLKEMQQKYLRIDSPENSEVEDITLEHFKDRCSNAIVYRMTRKNIILKTIASLKQLSGVLISSVDNNVSIL